MTISAQAGNVLKILVENRGRQNNGVAGDDHRKVYKDNIQKTPENEISHDENMTAP